MQTNAALKSCQAFLGALCGCSLRSLRLKAPKALDRKERKEVPQRSQRRAQDILIAYFQLFDVISVTEITRSRLL
jgi:hypothetical protein